MVLANLRLVVHIAQTYSRAGRELQDLIADGNLGLISAVERFDPSQGVRFGTYASYWIRQAIQRGIQKTSLPVRLPGYVCILLVKWRRAAAELRDQTGRNPTRDEVAQRLGLSKRTRQIVDRALDTAAGAGPSDPLPKTTSVETAVEDLRTPSPEHELEQEFTREWAHDLLARLGQREAAVLRMRFGLEGEKPRTLQEVGQCLDLTRERVRQIERQALERARQHLAG
jgi:RNA polymerase primary sigma factor